MIQKMLSLNISGLSSTEVKIKYYEKYSPHLLSIYHL